VEVRLLRPGLAEAAPGTLPRGKKPVFGVFPLFKKVGTCGF
jgi:hypothetical protein